MCIMAAIPALGGLLGAGGAAAGAGAATAGTWASMGAMAKLGVLAQAGAGVMGAVGAVQSANAQAEAANASAAAADKAAAQAMETGHQKAELRTRRAAKLIGEQKVAMAANGVDVTGATAMDLLDESRDDAIDDAMVIASDAHRQAEGYAQTAANYRTQANSAKAMGPAKAFTTLLGSASGIASRWTTYAGAYN